MPNSDQPNTSWQTYSGRLLWALKAHEPKMSQSDLARVVGVAPQSIQHLADPKKAAQGSKHTTAIAAALGINADWLASGQGSPEKSAAGDIVATNHEITTWDTPDQLPPDDKRVWIDRYDLQCSAGTGMLQWEIRQKQALPFTTDFFRSVGSKPDNCRLAKTRGSSMEPLLFDRDMIMIDTTRTTVRDGSIYVVWLNGEALVKQVFKQPGGGLTLHSFNSAYPDRTVPPQDGGDFSIVGEVIYRSGGGWMGGK